MKLWRTKTQIEQKKRKEKKLNKTERNEMKDNEGRIT